MEEMKVQILLEKGVTKTQAAKIRSFISMIKGVYALTYSPKLILENSCECEKDK